MFPIFNETNIYLPQRIAACVNVEVYKTDTISTLICKQCLKKINEWYEFKIYCDDSQSKLRYWSNLCVPNDPINYKSTQINVKEEVDDNCNEEETIIPENVEDIKIEPIETFYEDLSNSDEFSDREESDPVSTTMYFLPDENCEIEPEPETLLIPSHELSPDAHGLSGPLNQPTVNTTNGIVNLKIERIYQVITCRICEMSFSSLGNRSRHEKIKHMVNFKEIKCFICNKVWNDEEKLLDHFKLNHLVAKECTFIKPENKIIKNGYTYNTFEKSQEYLEQFAKNLILLRNRISSAKQISLKSFTYYNQCIQKMIDRSSIDSNISLKNTLEHMFSQNLIIQNSCHQCCVSFKSVGEFKQHISKRYCKKRVRSVESGQIQANQHFKCRQCDRIFGCKILLTHHIKSEHSLNEVPDKCNTCMKPFHYRHEYNAHIRETCRYQIYCSICELLFDTTDDFKLHSKVNHDNETNLNNMETPEIYNKIPRKDWKNQCCLCPKFYRYYQDLGKHFKNIHSEFVLKTCKYCGDNFVRDTDMQEHINNLHEENMQTSNDGFNGSFHDTSQIYLCDECNIVFSTIEDLEQHKTVHGTEFSDSSSNPLDSPLFACDICVQTFNFEEELKEHKITYHDNIGRRNLRIRFTCTVCRKTFNTNKCLVSHNLKMHSITKKQSTSCLKCHKTFKNMKSINLHLKMNHCMPAKVKTMKKMKQKKLLKIKTEIEDEDDPYVCIVCKRRFSTKKSLILHAKMHYQCNKLHGPHCEVCGKTCENVEDLLEHFKTHPSKLLNNLFNLNSSPQKTSQVQQLRVKQEQLEQSSSEHECSICHRTFTTKLGLSMHLSLTHRKKNKNKGHNCTMCEEPFGSIDDLINHVQLHIDNMEMFTCEKCYKSFLCDDYLSHMSKVHNTHACVLCNKTLASYSSLMSHKGWHYR